MDPINPAYRPVNPSTLASSTRNEQNGFASPSVTPLPVPAYEPAVYSQMEWPNPFDNDADNVPGDALKRLEQQGVQIDENNKKNNVKDDVKAAFKKLAKRLHPEASRIEENLSGSRLSMQSEEGIEKISRTQQLKNSARAAFQGLAQKICAAANAMKERMKASSPALRELDEHVEHVEHAAPVAAEQSESLLWDPLGYVKEDIERTNQQFSAVILLVCFENEQILMSDFQYQDYCRSTAQLNIAIFAVVNYLGSQAFVASQQNSQAYHD